MRPKEAYILSLADTEQWCLLQLKSKIPSNRLDAIFTLSEIGTTSTEEIFHLLEDEDFKIRALSARVLGNSGDKNAIPKLLATLSDKHWLVQGNAIIALGTLGALGLPGEKDRVLRILGDENHGFVDYACSIAFK